MYPFGVGTLGRLCGRVAAVAPSPSSTVTTPGAEEADLFICGTAPASKRAELPEPSPSRDRLRDARVRAGPCAGTLPP